jgi:hypothetical protein
VCTIISVAFEKVAWKGKATVQEGQCVVHTHVAL